MPYKPPPSEPIAVVASSCRFTGGATSPSKLWDLLKQPSDLSRTVPLSRFNGQAFFNPDGDYHGTTNATKAYWLDDDQDVRKFDADFFDIAPKEAEAIDPQQRLLLETVFEALESASYQLPQWTGKDVAVYVGAMTADFDTISQRDDLSTSPYYATGNARSILSNRISYFYNFHGPSVTIDTACSSSLVALHQAIISLRAGDCSAACVAGVNVMLSPEQFVVESSLHMLSPTGHCHMWDRKADGYARGEGAAVLLLKPLSRALVDGDGCRIQAVIRETGVGSDGRTAGITMPNPGAQAALIRATYRRAGLDISDSDDRCQYFEAHGTGTPVGDPREARAIYTAFFGELNENAEINLPCSKKSPRMLVGSVKTVIGHTEGAAGLAGLLKVMLAMKESKVPPNLHLERLNPQVAPYCTPTAAQGYLHIPTQLTDWPQVAPGQPLRASVNSFGFGGTNAHAIVERYDPGIHSPHLSRYQSIITSPEVSNLPQIPLVLSAKSARSLRVLAQKYLDLFQLHENGDSTSDFQRVAWLTHSSKTMFMHRLAVCGQSRAEAIRILTEILSDASQYQAQSFGSRARRVESKLKDNKPRLLGVFTGQGAQWAGMSKHLFLASPVYRESIRYLDSVLEICPDPPVWTLEDELFKLETDGSRLSEAAIAQPVCTALQIGLVHVLRRLGVRFTCVIGHSSGEIAAAYAAKYISARDAILIAYYRGRSVSAKAVAQSLGDQQQSFGMLAVGMPYDKANEFCAAFGSHLCAAASNSPSSSTLSGDIEAIQEADRQLKASSIFCRRVLVDKAYHSHYMAQLSVSYHKALESCRLSPLERTAESSQQTTWISSVGPDRKTPTPKQLAGTYWVDNMVNPVLFREATEEALHQGDFDCVVEVGPHATLRGPFLDTVAQYQDTKKHKVESLPYTSLLQRGRNDAKSFLEFLGFALTQFDPPFVNLDGILDDGGKAQLAIDLSRMHSSDADKLPSYPWDHSQKFYRESRITRQFHFKNEPPHELLGSRTRDDVEGHEIRWRNILRVDKIPWLAHHTFQSQPLLPASAYCIMALDAAKALLAGREASLIELEDVEFIRGVPLEVEGPATEIMFSLFVEHQPGGLHTEEDKKDFIRCSFSLYSGSESSSTCLQKCCTGRIHIVLGSPSTNALPRRVPPGEQPEAPSVSTDAFYDMMTNVGLHYTGPFRSIETMHRRHNFATASLRRFHETDSTRLSWSPAALDSCLQTCFVSYASPGDGALWTVFLPILMKRVSFNMACGSRSGRLGLPQGSRLSVDAQVIEVRQATSNTPARIEGDILIYNDAGDMEVCVEGLTVGSLVPSDADIDRELYLYTKYAPDPEVALVQNCAILDGTDATRGIRDNVLEESIQRVQAFYKLNPEWASIWPAETEKSLDHHILTSRYSSFLEQVRAYIKGSTGEPKNALVAHDELSPLQSLIEEGRHSFKFKHHTASIVKQIAHKYPHMSVISLTDSTMDLDENHPVLSSLNERGLETLRKVILRPEATILWVTKGSRVGNAENAASYGFTRSIRAEMPSLVLQMLDFDFLDIIGDQLMISCEPSNTSPSAAFFISDAFLQLMLAAEKTREQKFYSALHSQIKQPADHMWVLENEVFIDSTGQRLVPRMLPFEPSNDNFNALRRVVAQKQNTLSSCIELLFDTTHNTYQAVPRPFPVPKVLTGKPSPKIDASEPVHIQVLYSSTVPLFHGLYVIIGRCVESENLILSASKTNSSFVSVPKKMLLPIENDLEKVNIRACAAILVRTLFYAEIQRRFGSKKVVLIAPEGMLHQSVEQLSYAKGSIAIIQVSSDAHKACSPLVIHPRDTASQMALKLMRFGDEATFISFLPTKHPVLRRLSSLTPVIDASQLWGALFAEKRQHIQEVNCSDLDNLQQAWVTAKRVPEFGLGDDRCIDIVSVPTLLKSPGNISPSLKLVDWQAERMVECKVLSHGAIEDVAREAARPATQIRGDRTYVFIGITRDMGQSLATLLIKQGALYIVLASRSTVIVEPQWAKRARNMLGVDVQFEVLDVTDLAAVEQFRARVEKRMPRIGGIVNGAMVLQDQVFAQMTAETFSRVMRPKTVGSRNLDTVFHDDEEEDDNKLDFFIMMSSFAAVGGHAGQSNYSAANMYMNGIAADRQRRGVAGFALNIGVIYGLGFLHREKGNLYAGLEREGYPPISERDLHHMFLEAIAYGRPKANQTTHNQAITDLTAGLSRFNPQQAPEDALHWHKDPRFSHFTIDDDASKSNGRPGGKAASEKIHSSLKRLLDVINEETSTADAISLLLVTALSERLARLLHLDPAQGSDTADNSSSNGRHIRSDSSMVELGVDSLVAVQVRTWLWRTTGRDVSVMKVLGAPSIDILCHDIAGEIVAGRVKTK
ncbi:Type I Iterative PKS [Sporothrix epigloea]|uniref:Type I Iterative PKS n=1 Tax=Sporothrix epigloea TaxID=1892477 RepID=A0ABP0DAZ8_9PEZI